MEIINPIYEYLNEDENIIPIFVQILEKKTTEEAVFKKFKEDYDTKIERLKEITENVKKQEDEISNAVQKYGQKLSGNNGYEISNEAKNYFNSLNEKVNSFMHIYEKVKKGENYYNGLYQKIEEIIRASNKWMTSRNEEKNVLIDAIKKGTIKKSYTSGTSSVFPS